MRTLVRNLKWANSHLSEVDTIVANARDFAAAMLARPAMER